MTSNSDAIELDKICIKCGNNFFYRSNLLYRCSRCDKEFTYEELESFSKAKKAKQVLEIIVNNIDEAFQDQHGRFFARVLVEDATAHFELLSLDSDSFRFWVTNLYDKLQKDVIGKEIRTSAIEALKGRIHASKNVQTTHLRSCYDSKNKRLYYDPVDSQWKVIEIDLNGWKIVDGTDTIFGARFNFVRERHMLTQTMPSKEFDPNCLDDFINLFSIKDPHSRLLFKVYLISSFIPDFPHPLLVIHGDHGAAKSWFTRAIKEIVDPSSVTLLKMPKDSKDLMLTMLRTYFVCLDNVSNINKDESDDLCRAVTGDGHLQRELYQNDEVRTYSFQRIVAMNGINNPAFSPDLLDRVFSIELERLPREKRRTEKDMKLIIASMKPALLGYIFNTLSKALGTVDELKVDLIHRLADFLQWGEAISQAMGHAPGEFLHAYEINTERQVETTVENNPVAMLVLKFITSGEMEHQSEYVGTAEDLLRKLQVLASEVPHDPKLFPRSASKLSKKLGEIRATLMEYGIEIKRGERIGGGRRLTIRKTRGNNLDSFIPAINASSADGKQNSNSSS